MTKILFIQPPKIAKQVKDLDSGRYLAKNIEGFTRAFPSLPAMSILGKLKDQEVKFIDPTAENPRESSKIGNTYFIGKSLDEISEEISSFKPDITLITSMFASEYSSVNKMAEIVKDTSPNCKTIVGGHLASLKPEWHLQTSNVDYIFCGEAEEKFPNTIEEIVSNKQKERIIRVDSKLKDLDQDWELNKVFIKEEGGFRYTNENVGRNLETHLGKNPNLKGGAGVLYFSRGCPSHCKYCAATERDGKRIRHMSIEKMIELTEKSMELGIKTFYNASDTFGIHPIDTEYLKWLGEKNKNFEGIQVVNTNAFYTQFFIKNNKILEEKVDLLKNAGFNAITLSIESFNEKYNNRKLKNISVENIAELCSYIKSRGLNSELYMMYQFPGQTKEEFKSDVEKIRYIQEKSGVKNVVWRSLMLFPGTKYYRDYINKTFSEKEYLQFIKNGLSFYDPQMHKKFKISKIGENIRA